MILFCKNTLAKKQTLVYIIQIREFYPESKKDFRSLVKGFFMLKRFVVQGGSSRVTDAGGTE